MRDRLAIAAGILALTLLSYFQFPGHTYLASDTEIYVPMLEHIWDPSSLVNDPVASKPHLAYTLYDEIAISLRWLTGRSFQAVLTGQQLVFRAAQILGVFLLAGSLPLTRTMSMLVASLFTLGATIVGPAVLTFEYEPVPRAFAVGLVFLAIGLAAQNHLMLAGVAAAGASLYHAPTVFPFWALYFWLSWHRREYRAFWLPGAVILVLLWASRLQPGAAENQVFFAGVSSELERLQRLRTPYCWVSTWRMDVIWQYILLWIVSVAAYWRVRPKAGGFFLIGLPLIGIASVPMSYVLLEKLKWGLIPQFQPARAVLFVTAFAVILAAAAGVWAAERKRWAESAVWFVIVLAVPASARMFSIGLGQLALAGSLAVALCAGIYLQRYRWGMVVLAGVAIAPFFLLPGTGRVLNYPELNTRGVEDLARFARTSTAKNAVFLLGDAGPGPVPSIFRALSMRAVYVDWKAGGQMNYSETIAEEWWRRWREVDGLRFDPAKIGRLRELGIDYLVVGRAHRLKDRAPVYEDDEFVVYFE